MTEQELGALISDHPQRGASSRANRTQGRIALIVGAVLVVSAVAAYVFAPNAAGGILPMCLGALSVGGLILGWAGLREAAAMPDASLRMYERGLSFADKAGQKTWAWPDIGRVYVVPVSQRVRNANISRTFYRVENLAGDSFAFGDDVQNARGAYDLIWKNAQPHIVATLRPDFAAGKDVAFGPVTFGVHGLRVKNREIAWQEIAGVRVSGDTLFVDKVSGGWVNDATVNIGEVPNLELLLDAIGRRLGTGGSTKSA